MLSDLTEKGNFTKLLRREILSVSSSAITTVVHCRRKTLHNICLFITLRCSIFFFFHSVSLASGYPLQELAIRMSSNRSPVCSCYVYALALHSFSCILYFPCFPQAKVLSHMIRYTIRGSSFFVFRALSNKLVSTRERH